jgi:signal peptidase II
MRTLFWSTCVALFVDQISKYLVVHGLALARVKAIDVLPPLLNFRYGENQGVNFGLFGQGHEAMRWVLIALALGIIAGVLVWIRRVEAGRWGYVSAGLLIGGALGNVVDRLVYGYVLDFLNMSCCGLNNPFVFNVADVFIFAGAIGLVFFTKDPQKAP